MSEKMRQHDADGGLAAFFILSIYLLQWLRTAEGSKALTGVLLDPWVF